MRLSQEAKKKISQYFAGKPEIAAVYLFGSQVKDLGRKNSDIDLGVLVEKETLFHGFDVPQTRYLEDLEKITNSHVDVVNLYLASVDFAFRVISEGQILKGLESKKRLEFEEKILRVYFDMKPFFEEYAKSIHEMAKKGALNARYV